ncbi:hypothetical protein IST4134_04030 [Burkholderia cenocepacia]|nr:hypothetical protein IST4134_04030 [Burkholderia cenocepacia]
MTRHRIVHELHAGFRRAAETGDRRRAPHEGREPLRIVQQRGDLADAADAGRHQVQVIGARFRIERADRAIVLDAIGEVVAGVRDGCRRRRIDQPGAGHVERDAERRAEYRRVEQAAADFERDPAEQHPEVHVAGTERVHHAFPPAVVVRGVVRVDPRGAVRVVAGRDVERAVRRQRVVVDEVVDARVFRALIVDVVRVAILVRDLEDRARDQAGVLRRIDDRHHVDARAFAAAHLQQFVANLVDRFELLAVAELRGMRVAGRAVRRQPDRDADEVALFRGVQQAEVDPRAAPRRVAGLVEQRLRQLAAVRAEEVGQRLRVVLLIGFGLRIAQPLVEMRVEFVEQHLLMERFAAQLRVLDVPVRLIEFRERIGKRLRVLIDDERHRRRQRDVLRRSLRCRDGKHARRRPDAVIAVPLVVLGLQPVDLDLQVLLLRLCIGERLLRRALVDGRGHPLVCLMQRGRDRFQALDLERRRIVRDAHRPVVVPILHAGGDIVVVDRERVAVRGDIAVVREARGILRLPQLRGRVFDAEIGARVHQLDAGMVAAPLRRALLRGVVVLLLFVDLAIRIQHLQIPAAHARAGLRMVQQVLLRGDRRAHHGRPVLAGHRVVRALDVGDLRRVGRRIQACVRIVRVVGALRQLRPGLVGLQRRRHVDHAIERRELLVDTRDAGIHRIRVIAVRPIRLQLGEREVRIRDVGVVKRLRFGQLRVRLLPRVVGLLLLRRPVVPRRHLGRIVDARDGRLQPVERRVRVGLRGARPFRIERFVVVIGLLRVRDHVAGVGRDVQFLFRFRGGLVRVVVGGLRAGERVLRRGRIVLRVGQRGLLVLLVLQRVVVLRLRALDRGLRGFGQRIVDRDVGRLGPVLFGEAPDQRGRGRDFGIGRLRRVRIGRDLHRDRRRRGRGGLLFRRVARLLRGLACRFRAFGFERALEERHPVGAHTDAVDIQHQTPPGRAALDGARITMPLRSSLECRKACAAVTQRVS